MRIAGFSWAGVRTDDFAGTVRFFADVLGLPLVYREDDRAVALFQLPSGQIFEVFGPQNQWYDLHARPVLGFEVTDVHTVRQELEAQGVEFVTEVTESPDGAAWTYFRGPDGNLYELQRPADQKPTM